MHNDLVDAAHAWQLGGLIVIFIIHSFIFDFEQEVMNVHTLINI